MSLARLTSAMVVVGVLAFGTRPVSSEPLQAATQLEVTPATSYYASGPQGGFFWPSVQVYTLKNTGTAPLTLASSVDQPWVSILLTTQTINPGETWGDPITINSQANTLAPGSYTATVTFTNATSGVGSTTRTVHLIVGTPGDTTPPVVTISNPATPTIATGSTPITVSGTASDNAAVTSMWWFNMQTNDSGSMPGSATWSISVPLAAGDNQIHIWAWDGAGNQGGATVTVRYGSTAGTQMDVSPASGFTAAGPVGGPFNPSSQIYTVTNLGPGAMSFTATAAQPWVSVFAGSATLLAGNSWGVIVSFTGSANSLPGGTHTDAVTFTNTTNGSGNTTRSVSLVVGSAGDTTPPSIAIVNPAPPTASSPTSPITIGGTASDTVGVASIAWQNPQAGLSGTIAGAASWSLSIPLVAGSNVITITAWDAGGNSASASIIVDLTGSTGAGAGSGGGRGKRHCAGAVQADGGLLFPGLLLLGLALALLLSRPSAVGR